MESWARKLFETFSLGTAKSQIEFQDNSIVDAFRRLRVSSPTTLFDSAHQYDINPYLWTDDLSVNGTAVHDVNNSAAILATGSGTKDDSAILQSKNYIRYQPGKSQLIFISGVLGDGVENVSRKIGYFDNNNGIFFEQIGSNFYVVKRSKSSGTVVDTKIEQASWNVDTLDGTGTSGITLDIAAPQIFGIDLEWLAVGRVRLFLVINGCPVVIHNFSHANLAGSGAYMTTANLPVRSEIVNLDTASGSCSLMQICAAVISEGGVQDGRLLDFAAGRGTSTVAVTTRRPILSFKPRLTFNSIENRAQALPDNFEIYTSANIFYEVIINGTLTNSNFADVTDTLLQKDLAATAIANGRIVASGYVTVSGVTPGVRSVGVKALLQKTPLTVSADGTSSDIISLVVTSFSGTANVAAEMQWIDYR